MTKVSYIHGPVPTDEIPGRAAEVKPAKYFNPLVMSEGQAYLELMRDQTQVLSEYFPESRLYKRGLSMIDNALHQGVNGYAPFIGSIDPALYPIARAIDVYKTKRQPATKPIWGPGVGSWTDESLIAGEIPDAPAEFSLWWIQQDLAWLTKFFKGKRPSVNALNNTIKAMKDKAPVGPDFIARYKEFAAKYDTIKYIITLYNDTLQKWAHHPLYNFLPQRNEYPASVITKNILHSAGVQACAKTGEFSVSNMALWTRNSILRANIAGGVGAVSPEKTAFSLTGLPDEMYQEFLGVKPATNTQDKKGKVSGAAIGAFAALIPLIAAAIAAAAQMYTAAQQAKATALAGVQGWGTQAYAAGTADWSGWGAQPGQLQPAPGSGSGANWPIIIGAGIVGAGLLMSKK